MLLEIIWLRVLLMPRVDVEPRENPVLVVFLLATIVFFCCLRKKTISDLS